jgi:hypothetical protein
MRYGKAKERELRDLAGHLWQRAVDLTAPVPQPLPESGLARFRMAPRYQRGMQVFKWRVLPDFVFLPVILLVALWLGVAGATQAYLPWLEAGPALCASAGPAPPSLTLPYTSLFTPATPCHPVGRQVEQDRRYRVELRVDAAQPWFDGGHPTDPKGLRARDLGLAGILGAPFRRVIEANFLQPVVEIRQPPGSWRITNAHITPLELDEKERRLFVGEFKAGVTGELFLFANDAVSLHDPGYFYASRRGRNLGQATLSITPLEDAR